MSEPVDGNITPEMGTLSGGGTKLHSHTEVWSVSSQSHFDLFTRSNKESSNDKIMDLNQIPIKGKHLIRPVSVNNHINHHNNVIDPLVRR